MEQITVVIGDRLGKGQKVAAGVEKAGGRAVVVPGTASLPPHFLKSIPADAFEKLRKLQI